MVFKKAQAAMEFLMTYGWAILVVLVVIGALAYFGVLNPTTFVPDRCSLTLPLECKAASAIIAAAAADKVQLSVMNGAIRDIEIKTITISSDASVLAAGSTCVISPAPGDGPGQANLNGNEQDTFEPTGAGCEFVPSAGKKVKLKAEIKYEYKDASGIINVVTGEIVTTLQ